MREGESETVNVNAATLNPNPVMPKQWYEYIKKQQEKKAAEELEKEQKAYIALWLTESEMTGTIEEQYARAQERAALAERCLTAEELSESLTPQKILDLIQYRQKLFAMLLTAEETDQNTASKKLALCQERLDILQQQVTVNGEKVPLFSDTQLFASKWSQLQGRYQLLTQQKDWQLYLSVSDVQDLNISGDSLQSTLTANQQRAQKYLTAEQISQYKSWNELSAAINKAEATRKALEAEGLKAGLTQTEMDKMSLAELQKAVDKKKNQAEINKTIEAIKVLNPSAAGSNGAALTDMTLDELKALLSALQQERSKLEADAKAAGMTADEIKQYPSNAALQQAVNEKQKAQRSALIEEILKIEGAPTRAELESKSLDELKTIKAQLAEQASQRAALIAEIQKYEPAFTGEGKSLADLQAHLDSLKAAAEQKQKDALIAQIQALNPTYNPDGKTLEELQADLAALQAAQSSSGEGETGTASDPSAPSDPSPTTP